MKLLIDEICRSSAKRDAAKQEAVMVAVSLARNGSLDDLISRSSNLKKDCIINAAHVVYIDDPLRQNGLSDSYFLGSPSIIFSGMTPIHYQNPSVIQCDVVDRDTILELEDYILFSGSCDIALDTNNETSNRLFIMTNTEETKAHLYEYKSENHAKNVEMWLAGGTEPSDIAELAPMLKAAEEVRKQAMAESAKLKARLLEEREQAKMIA